MPKAKPTLEGCLDKAYARIDKILSDPDAPSKDVIAAMRLLAYYKGTGSSRVESPAPSGAAEKFLANIHKAS